MTARTILAAAAIAAVCGLAGFFVQSQKAAPAPPPSTSVDDALAMPQAPKIRRPSLAAPAPTTEAAVKPRTMPGVVALSDRRYKSLLAAPAKFIAKKTMLGDGQRLRGFLADPKRVDAYLKHPVIRSALSSPVVVRTLLNPAVLEAFVTSAAMRDAKTVNALAKSRLVQEIARSPGVRQALADPAVVNRLLADPQAMAWVGRHPEALGVLSQFGVGFARAAGARR